MSKRPNYSIKYGDEEWYLYHHYKNERPLLWVIVLSAFLAICNNGLAYIILIWYLYLSYCRENNKKLDRDPEVLEDREIYKELHEKYKE